MIFRVPRGPEDVSFSWDPGQPELDPREYLPPRFGSQIRLEVPRPDLVSGHKIFVSNHILVSELDPDLEWKRLGGEILDRR